MGEKDVEELEEPFVFFEIFFLHNDSNFVRGG